MSDNKTYHPSPCLLATKNIPCETAYSICIAEKHFQAIMAENRTWLGEDSIAHHPMLDEVEKEYLLGRIKNNP